MATANHRRQARGTRAGRSTRRRRDPAPDLARPALPPAVGSSSAGTGHWTISRISPIGSTAVARTAC